MAIIIGNALSIFILLIKTRTDTKNIFSFIQKAIFNMKNKEFYKLLKKNKFKPNSGFTLTELLVGLIMGTIVIAGAGWGLMNILRTTRTETNKTASRNETSRAFNFIADEVKAAQTIEVDMSSTNLSIEDDASTPDINEEVAPDFELPDGGEVRLALRVPNVSQRIIYFVAPPKNSSPWKGPLVIYRWGPGLNSDGNYITKSTSASRVDNPAGWKNEALIDGVSNESQTASCDADGDGTAEDINYKGFYACIVDDDDDGVTENADSNNDGFVLKENEDIDNDGVTENADTATIDVNGDGIIDSDDLDMNEDGVVDSKDNADDDGVSITAQLYFAAETGDAGIYKTDSQVVARARVAPLRKPGTKELTPVYFESLAPQYGRYIDGNNKKRPCWTVRNDFGIGNAYDPDTETPTGDPRFDPDSTNSEQKRKAFQNTMTWVHEDNRQPQPISLDKSKPFTMVASAFAAENPDGQDFAQCLARGNRYKQKLVSIDNDGSNAVYQSVDENGSDVDADNRVAANGAEKIHTYEEKVWHTIEFPKAGDSDTEIEEKRATYNGNSDDNPDVKGDGTVYIFKEGSEVPDVGGYDVDNDGIYEPNAGDQPSLRDFLKDPNQDGNDNDAYVDDDGYIIEGKLKPNQRIVTFEIGQNSKFLDDGTTPNPGYDFQDNMFIMTSDAFKPSDEGQ